MWANTATPGYGSFLIVLEQNMLKGKFNLFEFALEPAQYDVFIAKFEGDVPIVFAMNSEGDIASLSIPLEPTVKDIIFTRKVSESLSSAETLQTFCGKYKLVDGNEAIIKLSNQNILSVTVPNLPEMELEPLQVNKFQLKNMHIVKLDFKLDEKGSVVSFDLTQPGSISTAQKI